MYWVNRQSKHYNIKCYTTGSMLELNTQLQSISLVMVTKEKSCLAMFSEMSASSQVSVSLFHISPSLLSPSLVSSPPNITAFPLYISILANTLRYLGDATSRADPVLESKITVLSSMSAPREYPPAMSTISPSPTQVCICTPTVSLGHSLHSFWSALYTLAWVVSPEPPSMTNSVSDSLATHD